MAKSHIGFYLDGHDEGLKAALADAAKQVKDLRSKTETHTKVIRGHFTGIHEVVKKLGSIIALAFTARAIIRFTKECFNLAMASKDISDKAKGTVTSMTNLSDIFRDIKTNIGEAILESEGFQRAIGKLEKFAKEIKDRGFLSAIFEKRSTWEANMAYKMKWDVDRFGNPLVPPPPPPSGHEKIINDLITKIKEGAKESANMAEAWSKIHKEIASSAGMFGLKPTAVGVPSVAFNPFSQRTAAGLAGPPKMAVEETTDALAQQIQMVQGLTGVFQNMFSNIDEGFKGMTDSLIENIKRLAAELMAKAAVFAILKIFFPEVFIGMELYKVGGFGKFLGLPGGGGGKNIGRTTIAMDMNFKGKLSGHDILYANSRYGNVLTSHT